MHEFATRRALPLFVVVLMCCVLVRVSNNSSAMKSSANEVDNTGHTGDAALSDPNPLLSGWEGSYGGVPPFDRVQVALFKPALEAAMTENLTEVEAIANNSAPPTFGNTIEALERTGRALDRVTTLYGVWSSTMNGPEFQWSNERWLPNWPHSTTRSIRTRVVQKN